MPKKRTREQKTRAQYHYALPANRSFTGIEAEKNVQSGTMVKTIYSYDPRFITKDIMRTLLVSLIILGILLGLYTWLR